MFFNFGGMGGMPGGMPGGHGHGHGGHGGRRPRGDVDTQKFYDLLGVNKEASEAEIKKAFRKQAMTHHPDKGGDPEKFKEISKAYETLSDPQKKELYDEGGEEAVQDGHAGGGGGGGMDIFDLFGGGFGGGGRARGPKKGEDVVFPLNVTLDDLYNGTSKKLRLTKNVLCTGCKGKGGKTEGTCKDCRGQGIKLVIRQVGPGMIQQMQTQCNACSGTGSAIPEKDKCKQCHGEKTVKEKKTLEVFINKGMKHGEKIPFVGEGDQAPNTQPGDVIVVLQQAEHALFKREHANLFMKRTITLYEALCGFAFKVKHLDGRTILVKSEDGMVVKPGDTKAVKDEGFPQHKNPYVRGNLYITFDVDFPKPGSLSAADKQNLANLLPKPVADSSSAMSDDTAAVEEVKMYDVDMQQEKMKHAREQREQYEEDQEEDDDERGHRGGAQCRQQ